MSIRVAGKIVGPGRYRVVTAGLPVQWRQIPVAEFVPGEQSDLGVGSTRVGPGANAVGRPAPPWQGPEIPVAEFVPGEQSDLGVGSTRAVQDPAPRRRCRVEASGGYGLRAKLGDRTQQGTLSGLGPAYDTDIHGLAINAPLDGLNVRR